MKRKIIIKSFDGSVTKIEFTVRDEYHFQAKQKFKASVVKPKKGKGSFRRNKRVDFDY